MNTEEEMNVSLPDINDLTPTVMPTRRGRNKKPNPFTPYVQKSWDEGTAFDIEIPLESVTLDDKEKEAQAIKSKFQRAGNETDPVVTVKIELSEIEDEDDAVGITFQAIEKIRRTRKNKEEE